METLGELGIVGFLLIVGFVAAVIGIGATRSLRAPPDDRVVLASATAGAAAFAMAAALDWVWEIAALPVAFTLLAAIAVAGFSMRDPTRRRRRQSRRTQNYLQRALVAVGAVGAVLAIWLPLQGTIALRHSQEAAAQGSLLEAEHEARDAIDAQAYAASPRLQLALVLEQRGRLGPAAVAAREATERESTNWRPWLILARIEAERGAIEASTSAYRRARELNPKSKLFE
jgi:tetratricopeptide (TPR) repeat protein